jgi:hypothetical protein
MDPSFYVVMHLVGIMLLFCGLGGLAVHAAVGAVPEAGGRVRTLLVIAHGVGLVLILVGGFGLLAKKLHISGSWPAWVYAKLLVWLALGGVLALFKRKPALARPLLLGSVALGGAAAYLAVYKPFW